MPANYGISGKHIPIFNESYPNFGQFSWDALKPSETNRLLGEMAYLLFACTGDHRSTVTFPET
jgi:hypothetical protein